MTLSVPTIKPTPYGAILPANASLARTFFKGMSKNAWQQTPRTPQKNNAAMAKHFLNLSG